MKTLRTFVLFEETLNLFYWRIGSDLLNEGENGISEKPRQNIIHSCIIYPEYKRHLERAFCFQITFDTLKVYLKAFIVQSNSFIQTKKF